MNDLMIASLMDTGNQTVMIFLLLMACFRVYLELINFDFARLPVSKKMFASRGNEALRKFHRTGLYFSLGFLLLFGPGILLA
jgi:hypothetical protein